MQHVSKNLALTGALAALVCALPVSIDFARPGATAPSLSQVIGVGLRIDTAEARIGRPATPRSAAGWARRTARAPAAGVVVVRPAVARPLVARPFVAGAAVAGTAAATTGAAATTNTAAATTGTAASTGTTAGAGTAAAAEQQPSQAQISAIRNACGADFMAHCSGVQPGGRDALACLIKNIAALSPGCQQAVGAVSEAAPQKPGEQSAGAATLPASSPTGGATSAAAPSATLAPALPPSARLSTARPAGPLAMRLAMFRRACGEDVQVNCPGARLGGGQILACLAGNQASLSPGCRQMLAAAGQSM
jgi:hypothetical protein